LKTVVVPKSEPGFNGWSNEKTADETSLNHSREGMPVCGGVRRRRGLRQKRTFGSENPRRTYGRVILIPVQQAAMLSARPAAGWKHQTVTGRNSRQDQQPTEQ
jgi:hypothetical protein